MQYSISHRIILLKLIPIEITVYGLFEFHRWLKFTDFTDQIHRFQRSNFTDFEIH